MDSTKPTQTTPSDSTPSAAELNWEFYHEHRPGLDDYWRKMAAPRFRVATVVDELARLDPQSVVDLGCGGGQLLDEVRNRLPGQRELCGIDLAESQLEGNRKMQPSVRWEQANLDEDYKPPTDLANRFEAVVAMEVIEHLDHPDVFLRNARRLAASNRGALVLSTQSPPMRETERRVGHKRHFTRQDMRELLRDAGWMPVRVWNAGFPFHDLSKWYANLDPDKTMSQFGDRPYTWREDLVCWALRGLFKLNSGRRGAQLFAVARAA